MCLLTIQDSRNPVEYCSPQVDPADEMKIDRRVILSFYDVKYSLVEHSYRS